MVNHHYHWKWKEAEAGYEQAIELNPDHADTHLWYSWLLLALEDAMRRLMRSSRR